MNLGGRRTVRRGGGFGRVGRRRRDLHGVVRHDPGLLRVGDDQDVQSDRKCCLARLGDGNQLIAGLVDDVFPALGICHRLRGDCTSNAPTKVPPIAPKAVPAGPPATCAPATPPAAPPVAAPIVPFELIITCRTPIIVPRCTVASTCAALEA